MRALIENTYDKDTVPAAVWEQALLVQSFKTDLCRWAAHGLILRASTGVENLIAFMRGNSLSDAEWDYFCYDINQFVDRRILAPERIRLKEARRNAPPPRRSYSGLLVSRDTLQSAAAVFEVFGQSAGYVGGLVQMVGALPQTPMAEGRPRYMEHLLHEKDSWWLRHWE